MNTRLLLLTVIIASFVATASGEVIVKKMHRALPFSGSLGMDEIYKFQVRDANNRLHSRMVTAEVFNRYGIGEDFEDRLAVSRANQAAQAARREVPGSKRLAAADSPILPAKSATAARRRAHGIASVKRSHTWTNDPQLALQELNVVRRILSATGADIRAKDRKVAQDELKLVRATLRKGATKLPLRGKRGRAVALTHRAPWQDMHADAEGY